MSELTRRDVLKSGIALGATLASGHVLGSESKEINHMQKNPFKMKYAPHFGMFQNSAGNDLVDQIKFAHDEGFRAWEDNGMRDRSIADQERVSKAMSQVGMEMGIFVACMDIAWVPSLATGKQEWTDKFVTDCKASVEVAKRMNAKWMTVVPGMIEPRLDYGYQAVNVCEALKRGAEILEPHGMVMVIEVLNFRDHPGLFLNKVSQGFQLCKAVGSPACKVLFDMYHAQIHEGNIIPNIDAAWTEIGYYQIGDNPGRNEPTSGEVNYKNIFSHLNKKGFTGILGMEHGNSKPGKDGERAVIDAYRSSDNF